MLSFCWELRILLLFFLSCLFFQLFCSQLLFFFLIVFSFRICYVSKRVSFIVSEIDSFMIFWLEFSGGWLECKTSTTTTKWVCSKWIGSSFSWCCCLSSWLWNLSHWLLHLRLDLHLLVSLRVLSHHLLLCIHLLLHHHLIC